MKAPAPVNPGSATATFDWLADASSALSSQSAAAAAATRLWVLAEGGVNRTMEAGMQAPGGTLEFKI